MVKALIELDEETNQMLKVIKAKHGLKDKAQTITYIVNKFREDTEPISFRHLPGSDKWMFAEEIPDSDLYCFQHPFWCFVNNFRDVCGRSYRKIMSVFEGYHQLFYFGEKDAKEMEEHLAKKLTENDSFITEVNDEIIVVADKLREYCEGLPDRNLDSYTNEELLKMIEEHAEIQDEYYQWCWIPAGADMFFETFSNKLKDHLKTLDMPKEKLNEYFVTLTHPRRKSLIQIQRKEFLEVAKAIAEDPYHKKIFELLYKRFQEQEVAPLGLKTHSKEYEELLEREVSKLISEIKPDLFDKINSHYKKYFYVNRMWIGEVSSFESFLKDFVKLVATHADIDELIKQEQEEYDAMQKKRESLTNKVGLKGKWKTIFEGFGDFMITKIYRRYAQIYAMYKMEFILKEIAKRNKLTLKQVRFMLPSDMKKMLLYGHVDREELARRIKMAVYYAEEGKETVFTGVKAKQLAEEAKKVEVEAVQEFKGQVACTGKAKGRVKKIFRPKDMEKMEQGDILVSIATDPDVLPAMKKAAAIVAEQGGVTSHAAIVSREMNIPCVIGTKIATKVLDDGDLVEVDANNGIIKIIEKAKTNVKK